MKHTFKHFLGTVLLLALFLTACKKGNTTNSNSVIDKNRTTRSAAFSSISTGQFSINNDININLELLGTLHNQCLNYYYEQEKLRGSTYPNQEAFDSYVRADLKAFNESNSIYVGTNDFYPYINTTHVLFDKSDLSNNLSLELANYCNSIISIL
jgi:hypothetical protein